jgi:hypothetical protein
MKAPKLHAVAMVRRIRDRQAKALAGKSGAEVIAYYRDAGEAAMNAAGPPALSRGKPVRKALRQTKHARRKAKPNSGSRASRG